MTNSRPCSLRDAGLGTSVVARTAALSHFGLVSRHRRLIAASHQLLGIGSTLHTIRALQYPRWEDFNYERVDDVDNCLYWFGNGQTHNEKNMTGDRMSYTLDCTPSRVTAHTPQGPGICLMNS